MACQANERLLQTLKVHVPGAVDGMLELELFNVMDEFFRRTSVWRFETDIELEQDVTEYSIATPADTVIVRMLGVSHNGVPLQATGTGTAVQMLSVGELVPDLTFPDGDAAFAPEVSDMTGAIFSYAIYRPEYISITSKPDATALQYPLMATMILSVARSCLDEDCSEWAVEDWMWDMFFADWKDGVLGTCYGMPAKPWSSPTQAAYHHKRFRNAMAYRKQEALRGYTYGVPGFLFPKGGWT